jgi:hypothetical protein
MGCKIPSNEAKIYSYKSYFLQDIRFATYVPQNSTTCHAMGTARPSLHLN